MKDDRAVLLHVLDSIERISAYTTGGRDAFMKDRKTQDAVVRNLEIIGEAAKGVSPGLKKAHPEVPWKRIAGMRDKMIHEYFGVNLDLVWGAVERDVPTLKSQIESLLRQL